MFYHASIKHISKLQIARNNVLQLKHILPESGYLEAAVYFNRAHVCVCLISSESWIRRWGWLLSPYPPYNPFATYLRAPGPVYPNPVSN